MRLSKNSFLLAITILISLTGLTSKVQAQGTSADQYVAEGQQLLNAKNYTQATQYFYGAVKLDPNNVAAYQGLGNCYYMAGRKSDALSFYQRALTLQPGNTQLSQFIQTLQSQLNGGGVGANPMSTMSASTPQDAMSQGTALFQQKQYAASIPFFQQASQQNPNDYRTFYYAAYAYYMTGNTRFAALYFAVANMKQPNASIQAYADQAKSTLSSDDQQWVDDQLSKYSSAIGGASSGTENGVSLGFNFLGGSTYFFSNPAQIVNGVNSAQSTGENIGLSGSTPNMVAMIGLEPYLQLGQNFELDFGVAYVPVGLLSYQWLNFDGVSNNGDGYGYQNTFSSSMVMTEFGLKVLFGDSDVKFYIGLGGNIAPISTTFSKLLIDATTGLPTGQPADASSGTYNSIAVGGYCRFGVDFYLAKGLALGPYVGVQVLTATNFQNGSNTLSVNQNNGDVGVFSNSSNIVPLIMDYSNVNVGMNLKFAL